MLMLLGISQAGAQHMPKLTTIEQQPQDCLSLIPAAKRNSGQPLEWQETVALEHCDRVKRLWRLATLAREGGAPKFYETVIPASVLPKSIGVDVPVLRVVFAERVFFDTDSAVILDEARTPIKVMADNLHKDVSDAAIFVVGHTDSRGSRDYNQQLSDHRANSVADALLLEGTATRAHIWRLGLGKDFPLVSNDTSEHMAVNRRVEFLMASRQEAIFYYLAQLRDQICLEATPEARTSCLHEADKPRPTYTPIERSLVPKAPPNIQAPTHGSNEVTTPQPPDRVEMTPEATHSIVISPLYRSVGPVTPIYHGQPPSTPP